MDVVDPLAIWTGIGTGNEEGGIKMGFHSGYSWRAGILSTPFQSLNPDYTIETLSSIYYLLTFPFSLLYYYFFILLAH